MPSDSISAYDTSANKYTVAPTPMQQKRATKIDGNGHGSKDTIETPKAKSERLNPIQAGSKSDNVAGERAVKIARAGRFIFFSIALPPFFLMYSLPKMFALNVLPAMLAQVEKGFQHAKKLLQKINQWLAANLSTPFRNMFGKIKWSPKGIEKQSSSMMDFISRGFRQVTQFVTRPVKAVYRTTKKVVEQVKEKIVAKYSSIVKDAKEVLDKAVVKVKQQAESVYEATLQPVVNWMTPKIVVVQKQVEHGIKFAKKNIKEFVNKAKELIKPTIKTVQQAAAAVQALAAKTLNQITQFAQPVINLFVPTVQFLKKYLSFGLRWLKEKPKEQLINLHKKASKLLRRLIPFVDDKFNGAKNAYKKAIAKFSKALKKIFPFLIPIQRESQNILNRFINFLKRVGRKFLSFLKKIYYRFERQLSPVKKSVVHTKKFAVDQFKEMVKAPIAYTKNVIRKSMDMALKTVKFTLLVVIGFGLVFKYWFEMLFELTSEITDWSKKSKIAS